MADKRADQHRDLDRQDQTPDKSHRFINEKIVRQPMTRRQIARKILLTIFCAVLFGVLSAICFVVSRRRCLYCRLFIYFLGKWR